MHDATGPVRKALVVDDEDFMREYAASVLNSLGWETVTASNANEAYALVQQDDAFSLIFTDNHLGNGPTGVWLAKKVKSLRSDLWILLTSGRAMPERLDQSISDVIQKPFRRDEVAEKIDALENMGSPDAGEIGVAIAPRGPVVR